jgi:hypothetical protein
MPMHRTSWPPAREDGNSALGRSNLLGDAGNNAGKQPLASPPISAATSRAATARLSVGSSLLYLIVTGLVTTATIGVFFGTGFSLLVPAETEMPRAAALLPLGHPLAADPTAPPEASDAARASLPLSADDQTSASAPQGAPPHPAVEFQEHLAPEYRIEAVPQSDVAVTPQPDVAAQTGRTVPESGINVADWGFGYSLETARWKMTQGDMVHGRQLYLSMTLNGTQAAVDRMRADRRLVIEVRWVRENGKGPAANLVTDLTIDRPGLADAFEEQVRRRGFFEWHSWARRDALGPGTWTVSLTSSDGQLLLCGQDAQPCQFTINVG